MISCLLEREKKSPPWVIVTLITFVLNIFGIIKEKRTKTIHTGISIRHVLVKVYLCSLCLSISTFGDV